MLCKAHAQHGTDKTLVGGNGRDDELVVEGESLVDLAAVFLAQGDRLRYLEPQAVFLSGDNGLHYLEAVLVSGENRLRHLKLNSTLRAKCHHLCYLEQPQTSLLVQNYRRLRLYSIFRTDGYSLCYLPTNLLVQD